MLNIAAGAPASTGYNLTRSLRFRASASANLSRTFGSLTARTTQTVSLWFKIGTLSAERVLYAGYDGSSGDATSIILKTDNTLQFVFGGGAAYNLATSQVFRDTSAWYHLVIAYDTTQATASNRVKMYVNGVQVTAFSAANYPVLNATSQFSYTNGNNKISSQWNSTNFFDGYMADFNFIDGQALTPSSFGETNALTGVWQPKAYTGTYGTNGFYLKFTDNSTAAALGTDFSGNSNTWTVNNISVTAGVTYDSMTDVPTLTSATAANYAVLNPLSKYSATVLSEANLKISGGGAAAWYPAASSIKIPTTGKYYCEFTVGVSDAGIYRQFMGIVTDSFPISTATGIGSSAYGWAYFTNDGGVYSNGAVIATLSTSVVNDIIGVAFDSDAGTLQFYKNGSAMGSAITGFTSSYYFACSAFGVATGFINFGQRPFAFSPPTGFVALNTFNLPTATILAGNTVMDATLYTGTAAAQTIANAAAFYPDLVWGKQRSGVNNNIWVDSNRGATNFLVSNTNDAEATNSAVVSAIGSSGFTLGTDGTINGSGQTNVAWQWNAGSGSTSSNTSGSITSTVSVNAAAGFSIAKFTTQASGTATFGHGLGVAPAFYMVTSRSAVSGRNTYHKSIGATQYLQMNTTAAAVTDSSLWNNTAPTSSLITIGTAFAGGSTAICYAWSEIDGYSKFGSYTGNGSTNGAFIYTGFRPRFVMVKQTNNVGNWIIWDTSRSTYNQMQLYLSPNNSSQELNNAVVSIDALSNGFKCRTSDNDINGSGDSYIYMAFAENPFKNSLAR